MYIKFLVKTAYLIQDQDIICNKILWKLISILTHDAKQLHQFSQIVFGSHSIFEIVELSFFI